MESTGIYWIPVFEILESKGLEVKLVNARHVKNVPGCKSDVLDCQWLQRLYTYGLLEGAFRPPEQICTLRGYVRQRMNLVRYRADAPAFTAENADNTTTPGQTGAAETSTRKIIATIRSLQKRVIYSLTQDIDQIGVNEATYEYGFFCS